MVTVLQIFIELRPTTAGQQLVSIKPVIIDAGGTATVPLNIALPVHGKRKLIKSNYRLIPELHLPELHLTQNKLNVSQETFVPSGNIYPVFLIKAKIRNTGNDRVTLEEGSPVGRIVSIAGTRRLKIGLLC
jgi:hypothetical protein